MRKAIDQSPIILIIQGIKWQRHLFHSADILDIPMTNAGASKDLQALKTCRESISNQQSALIGTGVLMKCFILLRTIASPMVRIRVASLVLVVSFFTEIFIWL